MVAASRSHRSASKAHSRTLRGRFGNGGWLPVSQAVGGARLRGDHFHATITLHAAAILSRGFVGDAAEAAIEV